jgi:hypothetical protein
MSLKQARYSFISSSLSLMKSVQLSLTTFLLQYRQSHHILLGYVTAFDIGDHSQQNGELIEDKGGPMSGRRTKASTLNLWRT